MFLHTPGRFPVSRVCSTTSRVNFRSAECVPPRPWSISGQESVFCYVPVDFRKKSVFRRFLGRFPVGRVRSTTSWVNFRSAECVPPHPGLISGRQRVFCYVPGQFPVARVCSATSRVNFRSAECVPPRPGSISSWQSVFHHFPGQFLVSRVCSANSQVNFQSAEFVPLRPRSISGRQSVFHHVLG